METALEQKHLVKHNLLLSCKIQGLPITLLSGSMDEISEVQVGQDRETRPVPSRIKLVKTGLWTETGLISASQLHKHLD